MGTYSERFQRFSPKPDENQRKRKAGLCYEQQAVGKVTEFCESGEKKTEENISTKNVTVAEVGTRQPKTRSGLVGEQSFIEPPGQGYTSEVCLAPICRYLLDLSAGGSSPS